MASTAPSVLMVDDEPFILSATADLLRSSGYEVRICEQWSGAGMAVMSWDPDLILLDYNMPGLKGDELCRIIKRNTTNPDLRIIIFSSEDESDLVRIVAECGADGFIRKCTPGHVLLRTLSDHLDRMAAV